MAPALEPMIRPVLFEHIPKTGGVTFRGLLKKVYGSDKVFQINSRDIKGSLIEFAGLSAAKRKKFRVLAGHGALMFDQFLENPFRVCILREPVSLFLSQYFYLRTSKKDVFREAVSKLDSAEAYIDYAIEMGQDNLMTRFLSNSMQFVVNPEIPIPEMSQQGQALLSQAVKTLKIFDAVLDLSDFDTGVYALSRKLNWRKIPYYRPANITGSKPSGFLPSPEMTGRLQPTLKFDIELYRHFIENRFNIAFDINKDESSYRKFIARQKLINSLVRLIIYR